MKIAEFANIIDPDEVTHNEPPHQDLHCLPVVLEFPVWYSLDNFLFNFADVKFVVHFWSLKG